VSTVQLGLALPQFGPLAEASRIGEFAAAAEQMGFASLWAGDRLLTPLAPQDPYPAPRPQPYPSEFTKGLDPIVTLTLAAAATSRVRLGTSTLNAPQYNAVHLARSLTSLDQASGGRLEVGAGLGWMRDEYEVSGVDWHTRGGRLDEVLEVWEKWWGGEVVRHVGTHFRVPETAVDLRPAQPGGPPILLAGMTPAALTRVGRRADGWLMVQGLPAPYASLLWDTARRAAEAAGRDPDRLRRVLRINHPLGTWEATVDAATAEGIREAFIDLTYSTSSVDDALAVAATLTPLTR
jgi:probable F420-dependent oxidoreductase